ncbi:uncharacterized protein J7T54_004345 [Emericellopsis cladophorae]|uniref:Uncharacterized protein n=1 Tax=Emericellopsis cladophorae TaxID=2686198 RepID=A0A9P9Y4Z0_9HYPO|nr:uncharacterized protein J7T54_004345 [Emericellopsis cladophorae]KAI6783318.1 hypothetical protein J7T54_004345 [Emericellopsis cladophorae]
MENKNPSSSPQKPANLEDFEREPLVGVPPNADLGQEQVRREAEANSTAYGPPYPLHIRLSEDLSHPDANVQKHVPILLKIFPETTEVSNCFIHLHFSVKKLPPRPWPLTIGGKPFTVTDEQGKGKLFIFPLSGKGNTAFHLRPDIDRSFGSMESGNFTEFAETIHNEMVDRFPDLNVVEYIVDTSNGALRIVLADDVNPAQFNGRLPGRIANRWGFYMFERDLRRVELAHREISPDADRGIVDTTCYDTLRPGVLVHSKASSDRDNTATLSSSTGVMVRDRNGTELMTGASHRIGPDNMIFQKLPDR